MTELLVKLQKRQHVNEGKTWGLFLGRQQVRHGQLGGWATIVFVGSVPRSMAKVYRLTDWRWDHDEKHGHQLKVFEFEAAELENPRQTITATIDEQVTSNEAGTWFVYAGEHNDTAIQFVTFEPMPTGTHQLYGQWQESNYGPQFVVNRIAGTTQDPGDWLDMQAQQASGQPINIGRGGRQ